MPVDTLLVLELSESFSSVWPRLARECGLRFRSASSPADIGAAETTAIGIIAAGGDERMLESTIRAIGHPPIEIAAVGAMGDHRLAACVMRAGASEFFLLARDYDLLREWVREQRQRSVDGQLARTYAFDGRSYEFRGILGESALLRGALDQAARIIPHPHVTALITGETGTGKELLARALHENGPRRSGPFVDINCAAIPENLLEGELFGFERGSFTDASQAKPGLFEVANHGTLFLDEIGHLPLPLQGKLLRALEERQIRRVGATKSMAVDVRVIAATHVNLARAVRRGEFREDLYYRIAVVPIMMPPLRARPEDIVPLARHFLATFAAGYGLHGAQFTPGAERALRSRSWPGNVRELRNVIERAVLLAHSSLLDASALLLEAEHATAAGVTPTLELDATIHRAVCEAVEICGGNKSDAARRLGISRTRLQRLLMLRDGSETSEADMSS
jgi:two-component system, NtrC family, response regulator HydG